MSTSDHHMRLVTTRDNAVRPYCGCGWVGRGLSSDYAEKATADYQAHLPVPSVPPEVTGPLGDRFRP